MSTTSTKLVRSRTTKKRMTSSRAEFRRAFSHLRRIAQPSTEENPPSRKKRGRPAKTNPAADSQPEPLSEQNPPTRKKKRGPPATTSGDTAAEPSSTTVTKEKPSTRSFGQTCHPKTSHSSVQVIRCVRCDDLGHTAVCCTGETTTSKPPPLYCHQCKLTFKYTSSAEMEAKIQLCSAHRLEAEQNTERRKKADSLIRRIDSLRERGVPLPDARTIVGLNEKKYNKLRIIFNS